MDKNEWVAVLRSNKAEFQRLRDENPRADLDLSGADLSGCDLAGVPLSGVKLRNASLRGANCAGAVFRFADLAGADLSGANLEGANFHQAVLEGANLEDAALGSVERETRMCLHIDSFRGVLWSREEIETMLRIMNQNEKWEILYQVVPRGAPRA